MAGRATCPGYVTVEAVERNGHGVSKTLSGILDELAPELHRLAQGRHGDPFSLLGPHLRHGRLVVLCFLPRAANASLEGGRTLVRWRGSDFFAWGGTPGELPRPYRLAWQDGEGGRHEGFDAYAFSTSLPEDALARFATGHDARAWRLLGAHLAEQEHVAGVRFAVWAPHAERVSVVGDFNGWDGRRHPMRLRLGSGVWELFLPGLAAGPRYKFELRERGGAVTVRADPYGREFEHRPASAAQVLAPSTYAWRDGEWLAARRAADFRHRPMSVYELHLGSWRRHANGALMSYRELAAPLAEYVAALGFTHVELMPITEYPLDESWGYQVTGYFAPTRRHGSGDELRYLVDELHARGIGVILDWVPGHFPRDAYALARFDGTALFEYEDPRKGEHRDWGTLVFNYARHEVRSFLLSSACYWLEEFHFDALRVDAVASMLYLDYSRKAGEWTPNERGGRENLEAIEFLRELSGLIGALHPGVLTIAEESTDWAGVTAPPAHGGLGFALKWNMGWMHDTLDYFRHDPVHRAYHHERMTFASTYAWAERFLLPFSHDEVVHLKRSLLGRMPGDEWQKHANLRLLYAWAWTFPGKKLLFMGGEFAMRGEWDSGRELPWARAEEPSAAGIRRLIADLNGLYRELPALHHRELEPEGFRWLDADDRAHSVFAYVRASSSAVAAIAFNCTPVPREGYRLGLPHGGAWRERLNTDSHHYGGADIGNRSSIAVEDVPAQGCAHSALVTLPPLAALVLIPSA
jgi:1,4-alpha-glucan branching enzyme